VRSGVGAVDISGLLTDGTKEKRKSSKIVRCFPLSFKFFRGVAPYFLF